MCYSCLKYAQYSRLCSPGWLSRCRLHNWPYTLHQGVHVTRREYRKISATRQCGSIGTGGCHAFMQRCVSASRCASCPAKGEPTRPVARLATVAERPSAMRRQAHGWAMGYAAPQPLTCPDAQGPDVPEGHKGFAVVWARRGPYPAGCSTRARTQRTAPSPGRPSPRLDTRRGGGEPVPRLRRPPRGGRTGRRPPRHSTSARSEGGHTPGEAERWRKGAGSRFLG